MVTKQSGRESSGWSIWKVEMASVDCLLRTIKREGKERCRLESEVYVGQERSFLLFIYLLIVFFLFRAAPMAYGGSQARGLMGATAASLRHSHSNARSEPCL